MSLDLRTRKAPARMESIDRSPDRKASARYSNKKGTWCWNNLVSRVGICVRGQLYESGTCARVVVRCVSVSFVPDRVRVSSV